MAARFVGVDIGAETVKVVELVRDGGGLRLARRRLAEHHKEPDGVLLDILRGWDWEGVDGAAVSGRLSRRANLRRVPTKQAQAAGYRFLCGDAPATVVSIGSHGFSVLELRPNGVEVQRENSRCSQGTGNFLCQLVERLGLTIDEACRLCEGVPDPLPLSGRCPVILKTDMTHLANKGENRARILAGLFDAVCENVQVLIKPGLSPSPVVLVGGVSRSLRVQAHFRQFLARHGKVLARLEGDDGVFVEAIGTAALAADAPGALPPLDRLVLPAPKTSLERLPPLSEQVKRIRRMTRPPLGPAVAPTTAASAPADPAPRPVILGLDIGSTGSKACAIDASSRAVVWEAYLQTNGHPVGAAQGLVRRFVEGPAGGAPVLALGATGSGREIVSSLLTTCFGPEAVYVMNEIAAHAEGALCYDARVDTIFEIGGQDAKYIRLAGGRVVDAAMNEACSAGTGSFIEEQGRKFSGIQDVVHLGQEGLSACGGVSLGQHCSVFMAEIIDEAVAAGIEQREIIAGIYDSIIQNYLNRVKGCRSVGQVIFCQGMPFSSDALAAAVARQTGSEVIIPPNPGTVGALGIALLTQRELAPAGRPPLDLRRFLAARLEKKDTFLCKSTRGCGGTGNKCRIDRITTLLEEARQTFTWGGGCSLYDKGTRRRKLPDLAPDPFREREELARQVMAEAAHGRGGRRVALTDEFVLKGLFPFFGAFLAELGFTVTFHTGADGATLKRGIECAHVPWCAPMQLFHGVVDGMVKERPDFLFLPMVRSAPRVKEEGHAVVCPIAQASPDVLRWNLPEELRPRVVSPVIDIEPGNLESAAFRASCRALAAELGCPEDAWAAAHRAGVAAQARFDGRCLELGRRALDFCAAHAIVPVVVLGRNYTIYNTVLNSNVPALLREQGAMAIPLECYPIGDDVPVFDRVYWGYGQRSLRAAHQVRQAPGVYSVYCSNYACGPDSFVLHFYQYIMEGKPYAIIETDGHSGDAGTKTRIEAFLHCAHGDRKAAAATAAAGPVGAGPAAGARSFATVRANAGQLADIRRRGETILIPWLGPGSEFLAASLRGVGVRAEHLPMPDRDTLRLGRRHTSGKECMPTSVVMGAMLRRIEAEGDGGRRFACLMPLTNGPCRSGVYHLLLRIALERRGWQDKVSLWSPSDTAYFDGLPVGFSALVFTGFMAIDLLLDALYDTRPVETRKGAALEIYERYRREVIAHLEGRGDADLSLPGVLWQAGSGRLFGVAVILRRAAAEFAAVRGRREMPTVLVTGEIYARCDPFTNDGAIERLEQRGIRCRFAPFHEWLEYTDLFAARHTGATGLGDRLSRWVRTRIQRTAHDAMAAALGWTRHSSVEEGFEAAAPYIREELFGESVLTVGGAVHEWREGIVDAVLNLGPHECMPTKISEAQLFHVAEEEGLLTLTVPLSGDPMDPEVLDGFAFEVHARWRVRRAAGAEAEARAREQTRRVVEELGRKAGRGACARS